MSQRFFTLAWALGLAVLSWIGIGFVGHSWLALAVTLLIAASFILGTLELRQFRIQTQALDAAMGRLDATPAQLGDWLRTLPEALQQAVRQRVETGRGALPGPALTPYLVGLLVMLGMLGTFLGMVVTFQGTVFALEGSGDLGAMRAALAAPIRGLGLSFGTSVGGVAASALLGLMSAMSRRERMDSSRRLDGCIASHLRDFSLSQRREAVQQAAQHASLEATLGALGQIQVQGSALPTVAEKLAALMDRLERRGEQLDAQLLERQAQFQREAAAAYADLGRRVGQALEDNLSAGLDRALASFHERFGERSTALLAQVQARLGEGESRQAEAERQRLIAFGETLQTTGSVVAAMREDMAAAGERLRQDFARAEAQVLEQRSIGETREQQALQARADVMARMETLLATVQRTADQQQLAFEGMVASSAETLAQAIGQLRDTLAASEGQFNTGLAESRKHFDAVLTQSGERFDALLQAQSEQAAQQVRLADASTGQLASTGEAFGASVQAFHATSARLLEGLQRVEAALAAANARHDEQLAYYVAQAREVIDLSIASQQGVIDSLRQLQASGRAQAHRHALAEGDAA